MTWQQGKAEIERLLAERRLQRVPPSAAHAEVLIAQSQTHLKAAEAIADVDPAGAYQLAYDAARKALVAVLENQGLRPTAAGGHIVVFLAVKAQLVPPMGRVVHPFNQMRRTRNASEYPTPDTPPIAAADVRDALPNVGALIDLAVRMTATMETF